MDRLNREYIEILNGDAAPSEKFVSIEMRRSRLLYNLTSLINEGTIRLDDLEGFSDELIASFVKPPDFSSAIIMTEGRYGE